MDQKAAGSFAFRNITAMIKSAFPGESFASEFRRR